MKFCVIINLLWNLLYFTLKMAKDEDDIGLFLIRRGVDLTQRLEKENGTSCQSLI